MILKGHATPDQLSFCELFVNRQRHAQAHSLVDGCHRPQIKCGYLLLQLQ